MTRRYLMCPPDYFGVEYAINPWMDTGAPVDVSPAHERHGCAQARQGKGEV